MGTITIGPEDAGSSDAGALIAQLDEYQGTLYPAESNHLLSASALRQPNVNFLVARVGGRAAGCGAFVDHGGEYGELKRMFVRPEFRGLGIGRRILEELEALMRAGGLRLARLETGTRQPEALGLYEAAGYARCGPFGA